MSMNDLVLSAIVAAVVSVLTALISYAASRKALATEREKFEKQLQRSFTERLYELRLASYPQALQITEALRRSRLFKEGQDVTPEYLYKVQEELDAWHSTKAAFVLSHTANQALYEIRRSVRVKPESEGKYSEAQLERIWKAKGEFRKALRRDIILLYGEEIEKTIED